MLLLTIGTLVLAVVSRSGDAASYAAGTSLVTANLILHVLVWTTLIRRKKLIAFAALVVVFKYAIFGAIIYKILGFAWASPLWFCLGVSTFVVSAVLVAFSKEEYVI